MSLPAITALAFFLLAHASAKPPGGLPVELTVLPGAIRLFDLRADVI